MFCRKCGKEIPDDSVFCPKCGNSCKIEPEDEEFDRDYEEPDDINDGDDICDDDDNDILKCPKCGAAWDLSMEKCTCCGVFNPYYSGNTVKVETVPDNNTAAYEIPTTPSVTPPSSNAFDTFVSKTVIAARVIIIVSFIMYMILANGVLDKLDESSGFYGLVTAAIGLLGVCFLGACACRIVCAFIKGAREKELGWMIFITAILLVIAIVLGFIFKGFVEGVFFFALMLFAYCENRLHES